MARRVTRGREWVEPAAEQLTVMRSQLVATIEDGKELITEPLTPGRWDGWEINAEHLLDRALGPGHWPKAFRETTGGTSMSIVDYDEYEGYGEDDGEARQRKTRDEVVAAKLGVLEAALTAVDQELERRGAVPRSPSLPARGFDFMASDKLKGMAVRDYAELRVVAGSTIKATALLAGSVVEAVLHDALERKGYAAAALDRMRFHELIDEAAAANLIAARTKQAGHLARDIRNLVHPAVELRQGRLTTLDAEQAVTAMKMVLEELSRP